MNDNALIKFHIGPVQPFIEAARTIRDLWTGSYLLSWLVGTAMHTARTRGRIISPTVDDNPIVERRPIAEALIPCLPNHFEAEVPSTQAQDTADACVRAARDEWRRIASSVLQKLKDKLGLQDDEWHRDWATQIETYFEMRCVVVPPPGVTTEALHLLMDATRSVKHTPDYKPTPDQQGRFGMKCSLLGLFEQVGPANLDDAPAFWRTLAGKGFGGSKLREGERFCAVSLVKRFAWPAYLAEALDQPVDALRYSDTATVAASAWLKDAGIEPEQVRRKNRDAGWSGQWLQWTPQQKQEDECGARECPESAWETIQAAKRNGRPPPTYFAVLTMDGDNVGRLLAAEAQRPSTDRSITRRLARFALSQVQPIVERNHAGELIYAGGDDVLAVMPTVASLACARALYDCYRSADVMGVFDEATVSAGLVVAHYKENLRFVLEEARHAERDAKGAGRNRLVLRILRRSGEHTAVALPWSLLGQDPRRDFQRLVNTYVGDGHTPPPSDRWAYRLRAELPALEQSPQIFQAEMHRLLRRTESGSERLYELVTELFQAFCDEKTDSGTLKDFVTACQSASFLARGRDE